MEIITGKVIYPSTLELRECLTYELKVGYHEIGPHCKEISAVEVKEWLKNIDEKSLKKYIDDINRLEQKAINAYKEEKQKQITVKYQEKKLIKQ